MFSIPQSRNKKSKKEKTKEKNRNRTNDETGDSSNDSSKISTDGSSKNSSVFSIPQNRNRKSKKKKTKQKKWFKVGQTFESFDALETEIKLMEKNTNSLFYIRNSISLHKKKVPKNETVYDSKLKYYTLQYCCNEGGKNFKTKSTGKRRSWYVKIKIYLILVSLPKLICCFFLLTNIVKIYHF